MNIRKWLLLAAPFLLGSPVMHAGSLFFACDPSIDATMAGTCSTLNSTIAGFYNTAFSNVNARIYIQYGTTGLGESTSGFLNLVSYSAYRNALAATNSGSPNDISALNSLPLSEPALYSGGQIEVTSALGTALGLSGMVGTTSTGSACFTPGVGTCYNGIITVTTPANLSAESGGTQSLYYRTGGPQPASAYDFYSIVEHETDEVLGSISCIDTGGGVLSDQCTGTNAAAADLFRYNAGALVFMDQTPGAYFSYDGGVTHIGVYNTLANGQDYADFATNCQHVQDATGCLGQSFDITNDGGPELAILDGVGFNLAPSDVPEPGTIGLMGIALGGLAGFGRLRLRK